jgi:hypothetical protein
MLFTFCILGTIFLVFSIISMFVNRKWTLYTTAIGYKNYFDIINRLQQAGIKYKTKTPLGAYRNRDTFGDYTM